MNVGIKHVKMCRIEELKWMYVHTIVHKYLDIFRLLQYEMKFKRISLIILIIYTVNKC